MKTDPSHKGEGNIFTIGQTVNIKNIHSKKEGWSSQPHCIHQGKQRRIGLLFSLALAERESGQGEYKPAFNLYNDALGATCKLKFFYPPHLSIEGKKEIAAINAAK